MYKCFSRAYGSGVHVYGEDAYRKVSRRIEKCSRGFRAGDDGTRGGSTGRAGMKATLTFVKRRWAE